VPSIILGRRRRTTLSPWWFALRYRTIAVSGDRVGEALPEPFVRALIAAAGAEERQPRLSC